MKIISGKNGTGKTKQLVEFICSEHPTDGVLVCRNVIRMLEKLHSWGMQDIQVISYEDYVKLKDKTDKKYYIVNINKFLNYLGQGNIDGWTFTEED